MIWILNVKLLECRHNFDQQSSSAEQTVLFFWDGRMREAGMEWEVIVKNKVHKKTGHKSSLIKLNQYFRQTNCDAFYLTLFHFGSFSLSCVYVCVCVQTKCVDRPSFIQNRALSLWNVHPVGSLFVAWKFKLLNFLFAHFWGNQVQLNRINALDIIKINKFSFCSFASYEISNVTFILFHFDDWIEISNSSTSFSRLFCSGNMLKLEQKKVESLRFGSKTRYFDDETLIRYTQALVMMHLCYNETVLNSNFHFNYNFLASIANICFVQSYVFRHLTTNNRWFLQTTFHAFRCHLFIAKK